MFRRNFCLFLAAAAASLLWWGRRPEHGWSVNGNSDPGVVRYSSLRFFFIDMVFYDAIFFDRGFKSIDNNGFSVNVSSTFVADTSNAAELVKLAS